MDVLLVLLGSCGVLVDPRLERRLLDLFLVQLLPNTLQLIVSLLAIVGLVVEKLLETSLLCALGQGLRFESAFL